MLLLALCVLFSAVLQCSAQFPSPIDLLPDFSDVENSVCLKHGIAFQKALNSFTLWAVQMFDASAKYPVGLLVSNGYYLGSFDSCLSVSAELGTAGKLQGQYCLVDIYFRHNSTLTLAPHFSLNYDPMAPAWNKLRDTGDPSQVRRDVIHWAVCVPASCSPVDTQRALLQTVAHLQPVNGLLLHVNVRAEMCQTQASVLSRLQFTVADLFVLFLGGFLMLLVTIGSIYDENHRKTDTSASLSKNVSLPMQLLLCFSARRNLAYLTQMNLSHTGLDCIHGLRLVFMLLAISGHRFLVIFSGPIVDTTVADQSYRQWWNMYILNGMIVVDTFFVYSGLLTAYYLPIELDDKKHLNPFLVWLYRFIRLTPLYLAVLLFHATLLAKLGSGPLWPDTLQLEQQRCADNWWLNLLYLSNYVSTDQMCMFQSWYLSVDTHLFMVAVVVVYCMWRWPLAGNIMMAVFAFLAILIPFAVILSTRADPFMLLYPRAIKDLSSSQYFREMYVASHMRAGPYVVGVAIGYFLYKIKDINFSIPKGWVYAGHGLCVFVCVAVQYSGYVFYVPGAPYLVLGAALYGALHRAVWGAAVALNIFLLVRGRIDWLHRLLTWPPIVPVSRLTYCAYLVHTVSHLYEIGTLRTPQTLYYWFHRLLTWPPIVPVSRLTYCAYLVHTVSHLYEIGTLRTPQTLSYYTGVWMFVGDIFFTFTISLFLCLLVEAPFRSIERIIFGIRKASLDNSKTTPD